MMPEPGDASNDLKRIRRIADAAGGNEKGTGKRGENQGKEGRKSASPPKKEGDPRSPAHHSTRNANKTLGSNLLIQDRFLIPDGSPDQALNQGLTGVPPRRKGPA
ncbi:hypothetical protein AvCA_34580 [Azotobacter vinelandii CA]|uniref:Uncharacterized protein n=2 Tax=Azotobacter vinelandii TaxID=354 RepID=C1DQH1_AZOVD|nr:hypothetical protein Avin_34580 [Azotobacter vinelandii DJ]AGK14638.1 hypothetical protein AvCA_34580 [Azotobacter vinelandii CA]AGK21352.1 hypothetical protein AvCA6_34580 [Azotobacter vinelandii CA6]